MCQYNPIETSTATEMVYTRIRTHETLQALAALLVIFIFWNKKIPCIRITNEEIIFYRFMLEPDKITWDTIKRIDFYKDTDKVELILSDRKRVIDVLSLGLEGREDITTALRHPPCEIPFFNR